MTISTPAILFSAITLTMLAYTNRFFALAKLVRDIHAHQTGESIELETRQLPSLRKRLVLIKYMQALGVLSFIFCTMSTLMLFFEQQFLGKLFFIFSVLSMTFSLVLSLWEVMISTQALNMVLNDYSDEAEIADQKNSD